MQNANVEFHLLVKSIAISKKAITNGKKLTSYSIFITISHKIVMLKIYGDSVIIKRSIFNGNVQKLTQNIMFIFSIEINFRASKNIKTSFHFGQNITFIAIL